MRRVTFRPSAVLTEPVVSSLPRRIAAGITDHVILFGIDLIVLYLTLRMAGLTMGEWAQLPPVPLIDSCCS